ncbi:GNAT family protein [Chromatiaceae bacterium AAb-1]|nr:GNAT family protein [Chromatiaceae bacterium AAb-1]
MNVDIKQSVKLTGQRITLTPFDHSDFALFAEMAMCPQMMKHIAAVATYQQAKAAFDIKCRLWSADTDNWLSFGIADIHTGEKLGNIGLKIIDQQHKIAETGFMLKQAAQGRGIAAEALMLLTEYAFTTLQLTKLVAICSVDNVGSIRLLEKSGFSRERFLPQNTRINNLPVDDYLYGLVNSKLVDSCL